MTFHIHDCRQFRSSVVIIFIKGKRLGLATGEYLGHGSARVLPSRLFSLLAGVEAWMPAWGMRAFRSGSHSFNLKPRMNNPHSNDN